MGIVKDISGKRFGRLTAIEISHKANRRMIWECKCDCGNTVYAPTCNLSSGNTQSCGCLNKELVAARSTSHGMSYTREYKTWLGMKKRCFYKNSTNYADYGGRGITVCKRWMSFENFHADMGDKPKGMTLDRVDTDGDYEPSNCRWATLEEQGNNQRGTKRFAFNGKNLTISEWGREVGINKHTLRYRLKHLMWDIERAVTTVPIKRKHPAKFGTEVDVDEIMKGEE